MKEFDGICLQFGLHRSAEYLPVCHGNFDKITSEHKYPVFEELGVKRLRYIGFDCCPVSIQHMLKNYESEVEQGLAEFVCAYVSGQSGRYKKFPHNLSYDGQYDPSVPHDWWTTFSTGFGDILQYYANNYNKVDFVVMDIEGVELEIISRYDFAIRPKFMDIELHSNNWRNMTIPEFINGMLTQHGYECVSLYTEKNRPNESIQQALFKDIL